jgi:hypothetical protein
MKLNIFERKKVANNALVFLQFLFLNWSYYPGDYPGDFYDMAINIKCLRVDVTLTPSMWASSNITFKIVCMLFLMLPNSWFQKGTFDFRSNFFFYKCFWWNLDFGLGIDFLDFLHF